MIVNNNKKNYILTFLEILQTQAFYISTAYQTSHDMGDKKTFYTCPIYFGENYYIGDEVLRRQYLQYTDRSDAAVTEVTVTHCTDRRCSYWTPFNSAPDKPARNDDENVVKIELGSSNSVGPAKSELGGCNPIEMIESTDAMGPLNIMAAIIPFESTWSTAAADVDHLSWKSSSGSSFEVYFDDDEDESGESDN